MVLTGKAYAQGTPEPQSSHFAGGTYKPRASRVRASKAGEMSIATGGF